MEVTKSIREFKYNGIALKDPSPLFTLEQVREFYSTLYPEIVNAAIEGPTMSGAKTVYEFRRAVGTKGIVGPMGTEPWDTVPVIVYGPQGTGKTQKAEAIALMFGKFVIVDMGAALVMGEHTSEQLVLIDELTEKHVARPAYILPIEAALEMLSRRITWVTPF